jgi:hypothetical protein
MSTQNEDPTPDVVGNGVNAHNPLASSDGCAEAKKILGTALPKEIISREEAKAPWACLPCNFSKQDRPVDEFLRELKAVQP